MQVIETTIVERFQFEVDFENFGEVPKELMTASLCEEAVKYDGENLQFVPEELKTKKLCQAAFDNSAHAFRFIPDHNKTLEMCFISIRLDPCNFYNVPQRFFTKVCGTVVSLKPMMLADIPDRYKTQKMCDDAVAKCRRAFAYVPPRFRSKMMCVDLAFDLVLLQRLVPKKYQELAMQEMRGVREE